MPLENLVRHWIDAGHLKAKGSDSVTRKEESVPVRPKLSTPPPTPTLAVTVVFDDPLHMDAPNEIELGPFPQGVASEISEGSVMLELRDVASRDVIATQAINGEWRVHVDERLYFYRRVFFLAWREKC